MVIVNYDDEFDLPPLDYNQSKVPKAIKDRSDGVRDAIFGRQNKEFLAQSVEIAGVISQEAKESATKIGVKQDSLEQRFLTLQQETTNGDFNSAPEIIDARGGKDTLGQRLDETTAQLAQNTNQADFVKLLHDHNFTDDDLLVDVIGNKEFGITLPQSGHNSSYMSFAKNSIDDYIRLREGSFTKTTYEYKENKNYDAITGTWASVIGNNRYTTEVGSGFSVEFEGTSVDFGHYKDNRGGLWEFVVDGDTENKVQVSTWSENIVIVNWTPVFRDLAEGQHTLVATFLGEDPSKSYTEMARGWAAWSNVISSPTNLSTIRVFGLLSDSFDVFDEASVKEFAITVRDPYDSSQSSVWMPQHGGSGTVYAENSDRQRVYFDGEENLNWDPRTGIAVNSVRIEQELLGYNPSDMVNPLVRIFAVHTINNKGLHIKHTFKAVRDVYMGTGYPMMFPISGSFATKLITGLKEQFSTTLSDGSRPRIQGYPTSFAMTNNNDDDKKDVVVAMTVDDAHSTYILAKKRTEFMFLEHRSDGLQKVYIPTFQDHTMKAGDTYTMGGTYYIGELPFANDILV